MMWDQPGVPHKGWTCLWVEDLGEPSVTCEMCRTQVIRYVHRMTHPDHDDLEVGCVCAGHMEDDYEAAKSREQRLKSQSKARKQRRQRWTDMTKWKKSVSGNYRRSVEDREVGVFQSQFGTPGWKARMGSTFSKRVFPTPEEAAGYIFDGLYPIKKRMAAEECKTNNLERRFNEIYG